MAALSYSRYNHFMVLRYTLDNSLRDFDRLTGDYLVWHRSVLDVLCFPDQVSYDYKVPARPELFEPWASLISKNGYCKADDLERLKGIQNQIHKMAEVFVSQITNSRKPLDREQFKAFNVLYDEFIKLLHKIDKNSRIENAGIDVRTGLKTSRVMELDIDREIERLAREGVPFCVGMIRIDFYKEILDARGDTSVEGVEKIIAHLIMQCLRNYDDGYRSGDGEFLIILKQTDVHGGIAAIQRLNSLLEEQHVHIDVLGVKKPLSISACVAEPFPEDDVDKLLTFLRDDLKNAREGASTLMAFVESSPIERYVQSLEQDLRNANPAQSNNSSNV